MWIKSRDKLVLIEVVEISKYKMGKKYYLSSIMKSQNFLKSGKLLGIYSSEEAIDREILEIENCLINGINFYALK